MVLHPALGGLRVNDNLHKPPQDGSDLGAGGGSFRVKAVAAFPRQDARLLHGFDFLCRPAADLCVICKGHSIMGTEMPGIKNNRTQARVIAGFCQPFHPALAICIDRIQITGLFFISAPLSCLFADANPFSIHSFCLFVFIQISFVSPDADVILLFCF